MAKMGIKGFGPVEGIPGLTFTRDKAGRARDARGKFLSKAQLKIIADSGWTVPIGEILKDLDGEVVTVGFFSEEVAQRAAWNEFGTSRIPSRPFMRSTFDSNLQAYKDLATLRVGSAIDNKTSAPLALVPVANRLRNDLIRAIQDWSDPPNAPATIAIKGVDNPLVDTGEMQRNIEIKMMPSSSEEAST